MSVINPKMYSFIFEEIVTARKIVYVGYIKKNNIDRMINDTKYFYSILPALFNYQSLTKITP